MNDFTPTTDEIVAAYVESRRSTSQVPEMFGCEEFYHWLAAHDKGIRDAVKPPELTAREHLVAAFEAAFPVPEGRDVPVGVPIIARWEDGDISFNAMGRAPGTSLPTDRVEIRTLDPLPPVIPDDCYYVWAQVERPAYRSARIIFRRVDRDGWVGVYKGLDIEECTTADLIDPKPVPEEER